MLSEGDGSVSCPSSCAFNSGVDGSLGYSVAGSSCWSPALLAAFAAGVQTKSWRCVSSGAATLATLDVKTLAAAFLELVVTKDACAPATLC